MQPLPISILQRTDSSIIYELPAGKPNPHLERPIGEDTRERVLQLACKGNMCWYYTFRLIAPHIGKKAPKELAKERKLEKACSLHRKAQTAHINSLPAITDQLHTEMGFKTLKNIDIKKAEFFIKNRTELQPILETEQTLEGLPSLFPFLEEFLKEGIHKNMHEFLLNKKFSKLNQNCIDFLHHSNVDIEESLKSEISAKNGYDAVDWQKLDVIKKAAFLDILVRNVVAKAYNLQKASWTPSKGIDSLIVQLKAVGPLYIGGSFGKFVYVNEPFKMSQKISERDIYAWRPKAQRHAITFSGNSVLLIGAEKVQRKAFVYYIDSDDPSDPKNRSKQKIYKISFENLTSHICDLHGRFRDDSPVGYAYHGSFNIS